MKVERMVMKKMSGKKTIINAKVDLKPAVSCHQRDTHEESRFTEIDPMPYVNPRVRKAALDLLDDLHFIDGKERTPFNLFSMLLNNWLDDLRKGSVGRMELALKIVDSQKYAAKMQHKESKARQHYVDRLLKAIGCPQELLFKY